MLLKLKVHVLCSEEPQVHSLLSKFPNTPNNPLFSNGNLHYAPLNISLLSQHASHVSPFPDRASTTVPQGVFSPAESCTRLPTASTSPTNVFYKFFVLVDPESRVSHLKDLVVEKYRKLYPNAKPLSFTYVKDVEGFDIDPDFPIHTILRDLDSILIVNASNAERLVIDGSTALKNGLNSPKPDSFEPEEPERKKSKLDNSNFYMSIIESTKTPSKLPLGREVKSNLDLEPRATSPAESSEAMLSEEEHDSENSSASISSDSDTSEAESEASFNGPVEDASLAPVLSDPSSPSESESGSDSCSASAESEEESEPAVLPDVPPTAAVAVPAKASKDAETSTDVDSSSASESDDECSSDDALASVPALQSLKIDKVKPPQMIVKSRLPSPALSADRSPDMNTPVMKDTGNNSSRRLTRSSTRRKDIMQSTPVSLKVPLASVPKEDTLISKKSAYSSSLFK